MINCSIALKILDTLTKTDDSRKRSAFLTLESVPSNLLTWKANPGEFYPKLNN